MHLHHHRSSVLLPLMLIVASVGLSACGGSASLPAGGGVGTREAASTEVRAGDDSIVNRMLDSYSPPATSTANLSVTDPMSSTYDPEMLDDPASMETLDLDTDVFSQASMSDLSLDSGTDMGSTMDIGLESDPMLGDSGGFSLDSELASSDSQDYSNAFDTTDAGLEDPMMDDPGMEDPMMEDPGMEDPMMEDPMMDEASW